MDLFFHLPLSLKQFEFLYRFVSNYDNLSATKGKS